MLKVIREYIEESELYKECMDRVDKLHFDSQKIAMINGAHSHQEKADKLAEIIKELVLMLGIIMMQCSTDMLCI